MMTVTHSEGIDDGGIRIQVDSLPGGGYSVTRSGTVIRKEFLAEGEYAEGIAAVMSEVNELTRCNDLQDTLYDGPVLTIDSDDPNETKIIGISLPHRTNEATWFERLEAVLAQLTPNNTW